MTLELAAGGPTHGSKQRNSGLLVSQTLAAIPAQDTLEMGRQLSPQSWKLSESNPKCPRLGLITATETLSRTSSMVTQAFNLSTQGGGKCSSEFGASLIYKDSSPLLLG